MNDGIDIPAVAQDFENLLETKNTEETQRIIDAVQRATSWEPKEPEDEELLLEWEKDNREWV